VLLLLCALGIFNPDAADPSSTSGITWPSVSVQGLLEQVSGTLQDTVQSVSSSGSEDFEIHYLNVGEGLSVLVRSNGHSLLYDGGPREKSSFVVSYLQNQGIEELDYLIASHYDADHLNGLIGALHAFSVKEVIGPDYVHDSKTYQSFMSAVSDAGLTVTSPSVGSTYSLGDASFTILSPSRTYEDSNNNSVAIRLVNGGNSFLLSGDAETAGETAMCQSGLTLHSDVICPGHHGAANATSELFLQYTSPSYAVISVGDNDYGHPTEQTLQRLANAGVTVLRTDQLGTIIARSDGYNITWSY
jgi:beta-lactamase superfamily II metal-dependent hydrolase